MKKLLFSIALLLGLCTAPVVAQDKAGMMGEHEMSGTVQNIDHKKGTFQLKTHAGMLHLHFPPGTVKDVKNGDALTVQLGFRKGASPMHMK